MEPPPAPHLAGQRTVNRKSTALCLLSCDPKPPSHFGKLLLVIQRLSNFIRSSCFHIALGIWDRRGKALLAEPATCQNLPLTGYLLPPSLIGVESSRKAGLCCIEVEVALVLQSHIPEMSVHRGRSLEESKFSLPPPEGSALCREVSHPSEHGSHTCAA